MQSTINRLYSKQVIRISENDTLAKADDMMNNYNIRHLPVIDKDNYLVGIISKSDFIGLKYADSRFTGFTVKDVMTSPVKIVLPTTPVSDVADIMLTHKISSVLIARNDDLLGIITTDDLLRLLLDMQSNQEKLEQIDLQALADEGWVSATFN